MLKFKESKESVASDLLLWQSRPTQVSIKDTYELKIHPVTSIFNEGPIHFEIKGEPRGMISNIDIAQWTRYSARGKINFRQSF